MSTLKNCLMWSKSLAQLYPSVLPLNTMGWDRSWFHDSLGSTTYFLVLSLYLPFLLLNKARTELINGIGDFYTVDRAKQSVRRSLRRKRPSSLKSRLGTTPTLPPIPSSDAVELVSETPDNSTEYRRPSFKHSNSDLNLRPTTLDTTGNGRRKAHLQQGFEPRGFRWVNFTCCDTSSCGVISYGLRGL